MSWTEFWSRAKALGYQTDRAQMERIIGALGANPQQALDRLLAVKHEAQRAFAS